MKLIPLPPGDVGKVIEDSAHEPVYASGGTLNCDPEVTEATSSRFELRNRKKPRNFIIGELFRGGELEFWVENLPKDGTGCPGWWLFDQMMKHFGKSVTCIIGYWVSGDNLAVVNSLTAGGALSLEEAATRTRTGGYAKSWGYTTVDVIYSSPAAQGTQGTQGNYSRVFIKFKK